MPDWTEVTEDPPVLDRIERDLWDESAYEFRVLERRGLIGTDEQVEAYLARVLEALYPADSIPTSIGPPTVHLILLHAPLAMTDPTGRIYVSIGMLATLESEDELAALLGHEVAHFIARDAYRYALYSRQTTWVNARMHYSRRREKAADAQGMRLAEQAGYDGLALRDVLAELGGWDNPVSVFFDTRRSHPLTSTRLREVRRSADASSGDEGRVPRVAAYEDATSGLWLLDARLALGEGAIEDAHRSVDRYVRKHPDDARGHLARGELLRSTDEDGKHMEDVQAAFERAYELAPDDADVLLALGTVLCERGDHARARRLLGAHLEARPDAWIAVGEERCLPLRSPTKAVGRPESA